MTCIWLFAAATDAPSAAPVAVAAPTRVGQVALVTGKVAYRAAGAAAWADAAVGDPVAAGTALRTEAPARAELRIGRNTIDISGGSEARIAALDDAATEVALVQGRIDFDLRAIGKGELITIDIPVGHVRLLEPGLYDVAAGTAGTPARIAVFTGSGQFVGGGAKLAIPAGKRAVLSGDKTVTATSEPATTDAFVDWTRSRTAAGSAAPPGGVSRDISGLAALADHGKWQGIAGEGPAWFPDDLPAGWAPYRYGHWRWIEPWGWTWIDDQPWGFAPSHYGRWASKGGRWAWLPGAPVAHPAYAPALVDFLGTPAVGVSVAESSGPAIGWFPLAPGEIYWPRYSHDLAYIRRLNAASVTDPDAIRLGADGKPPVESVTRRFANRAFATVVPRPVFVKGEPVAAAQVTLPEQRLANVPVLLGSPQIGPPHVAAAPHPAVAALRPKSRKGTTQHVAARSAPAAAHRVAARAGHRHAHGAHNRVPAYARAPRSHHVHLAASHEARFGSSRPARHRHSRHVHLTASRDVHSGSSRPPRHRHPIGHVHHESPRHGRRLARR